jgi:hypothetical protein
MKPIPPEMSGVFWAAAGCAAGSVPIIKTDARTRFDFLARRFQ